MTDCVLDASVVHCANGLIGRRRPGSALDRRLSVLEEAIRGNRRLRYNSKLLTEYQQIVKEFRNDIVEALFELLTTRSVFVRRSTLSRQHHQLATERCRWPRHDQHLLAAALGGDNPSIAVTEERLNRCADDVLRHFDIRIEYLG